MRNRPHIFFGSFLIGLISLAIAPRGWLHHCEEDGAFHHDAHTAAFTTELSCDACEAVVALFNDAIAVPLIPHIGEMRFVYRSAAPSSYYRSIEAPSSRGPPSC